METEKPNSGDEGGDAFARNTDPETSHEAAAHVRGKRAAILKTRACQALRAFPNGLTASEIADWIGCPRDSVSPRMKDLVKERRVTNTGTTRVVRDHRSQIVWKLHPEELERLTDET